MSFSKTFNAALALVEGRTRVARDILADPTLDLEGSNIVQLQSRLEDAVQTVCTREIVRVLKQILVDALRLEPAAEEYPTPKEQLIFLQGQEQLVQLIEERVEKLEGDINEEVHVPRLPTEL